MRIAVDAMGGDYAPETVVEGSVLAAREYGVEIILVGHEDKVRTELARHNHNGLKIEVRHASEVAEMHEAPSEALRKKKDSSIRVATNLVKSGEAQAVVSAGNTGVAMATALFVLGRMADIERPAIATIMPTLTGASIMLDVGANVDCKPIHLLQFAIMGNVFAQRILGKESPRVGLLSIGEEETKGNELTKESFKLVRESTLNFVGNVEGRDVFNGNADVIVCDGFTGNVALKISEGLADAINRLLKKEIASAATGKLGYFLLKPAFARFKKRVDYSEYGGAPLLGLNGISIISHGRSSGKAIKNAIRVAKEFHENEINQHIHEGIEENLSLFRERQQKNNNKMTAEA
ncbi:MAG: phosphate acyltransferase PlsX [Nitrospirota bacterium]|nr:phosphate acyltransferase PlsX [Nitrospirota bacterium]